MDHGNLQPDANIYTHIYMYIFGAAGLEHIAESREFPPVSKQGGALSGALNDNSASKPSLSAIVDVVKGMTAEQRAELLKALQG